MKRLIVFIMALLLGCVPVEPPPEERPTPAPRPARLTPTPTSVNTPTPISVNPPTPTSVNPPTPTAGTSASGGKYSHAGLSLEEGGSEATVFTTDNEGLFLNFETEDVPAGVMLRSSWRYLGREAEFSASEGQPAPGSEQKGGSFVLDPPQAGWPVGEYEVVLYVGDRPDRRLTFTLEQPERPIAEPTPRPSTSATPAPVAKDYKQLARQLVHGKKDEREKAEALYRWLAQNVSYNTEAYFSGDYGDCSPEAVFKTRSGVCSGYANLFKAMADEVQLESEVIPGFSKGYSFEPDRPLTQSDHAWNAVKVEGRWYLLDSTWGAGYIDERKRFVRRFSDFWFMTPPERFIYSHLPEQERWQLLSEPLDRDKYRSLPRVKPKYFEYGLKSELKEGAFKCDQEVEFSLQVGQPCQLGAALELNGERVENFTLVRQEADRFTVRARFPKPGNYDLMIFVYPPGQNRGESALVYQAHCQKGQDNPFPFTYSDFQKHEVDLLQGDLGILSRGRSTRISLRAPRARKMYLMDGDNRTPLNSSGDKFELEFVPRGDSITLYGSYWDDGRAVGLLKYQVAAGAAE